MPSVPAVRRPVPHAFTSSKSIKPSTTFGNLTVVRQAENNKWGAKQWCCVCVCGKEKIVVAGNLVNGHTRGCGCINIGHLTHGMSESKTYRTWEQMHQRCRNSRNINFKHYGGRGISVCKRWDNFSLFLSDMGVRPNGISIDRIDVNGDYEPGNCRWADWKTQARNKRNNRKIEYRGTTKCVAQWEQDSGFPPNLIYKRLRRGWPIEKALSTPNLSGAR